MPPSAITVCAFPSSDLQRSAVLAPIADASMAARRPAPPAPTTTTSNSCVSRSAIDLKPAPSMRIRDHAVRHQSNIQVGEHNPHEAAPRPEAVVDVPNGDAIPKGLAGACPGSATEAIEPSADKAPEKGVGRGGKY